MGSRTTPPSKGDRPIRAGLVVDNANRHHAFRWAMCIVWLACLSLSVGCAIVNDGGQFMSNASRTFDLAMRASQRESDSESPIAQIANPPAKSIRFDGPETVLGVLPQSQLSPQVLSERLNAFLAQGKFWSAAQLVAQQMESAEEVLWSRWADEAEAQDVQFLAQVLSRERDSEMSWNAMLRHARQDPTAARAYRTARVKFLADAMGQEAGDQNVESLRLAAEQVQLPLARIDALRLLALHAWEQGSQDWAESLLLQSITLAESHGDLFRAATLRLLLSEHARRSPQRGSEAPELWQDAVSQYVQAQQASDHPLRAGFWVAAMKSRPAKASWPRGTIEALLPTALSVGCPLDTSYPVELVMGAALGNVHRKAGRPQLALLQFKQAETFAKGSDKMWLRIAQSECLASMGQTPAASAVLSSILAADDALLAAAANAALGSAKLQSGAFQQGARLLHRALSEPSMEWPGRANAEADLALAQLILGNMEQGLPALHAAQRRFELAGDVQSLLQSLENEAKLLEHEQDDEGLRKVEARLLAIEQSSANTQRSLGTRRSSLRREASGSR